MKALLLAALVAAPLLAVPGRAQNPVETPQDRENYRITMRQELDKLGERVSALELRARVEKTPGREDLQTRTGELRARKKAADELFGLVESGSEAERRSARARLDQDVRDLRTEIEKAEGGHPNWGR